MNAGLEELSKEASDALCGFGPPSLKRKRSDLDQQMALFRRVRIYPIQVSAIEIESLPQTDIVRKEVEFNDAMAYVNKVKVCPLMPSS